MKDVDKYLYYTSEITSILDRRDVSDIIDVLAKVKESNSRVFCLGLGGGASIASHAVNDLRKLCGIKAYTPTDNVAEFTAWINDVSWEGSFREYLINSKLSDKDCLFIFSVGGGNVREKVSVNIIEALLYAIYVSAKIVGIVGRDGGETKKYANACVIIPTVSRELITPLTESFQSVILHLIVTHPKLKENNTFWENQKQYS